MVNSAITFTWAEVSAYYAERVPYLKQSRAAEWRGPCPIHQGRNGSFAVNAETGLWTCFSKCGRGGDIINLERELTGADFVTARSNVFQIIGRDLPQPSQLSQTEKRRFARRKLLAENLATSARRWHRATVAMLSHRKATELELSPAWMASCRELYLAESLSPRDVLDVYMRAAREEPAETARRIAWAEADERDCARVTALVVWLIMDAKEKINA